MQNSADIVIVGGGAIGLAASWLIASSGRQVILLERGELGREASWAGAGIIPPGNSDFAVTPFDRFRATGSELFRSIIPELVAETGIDCGYRISGGLEFLDASDESPTAWRAERIPFERLDAASIRALLPGLGDIAGTPYHLPGMAQIRNPWYLRALRQACEQNPLIRIEPHSLVTRILCRPGRVTGVQIGDEVRLAEKVIVTTGAWADELLRPLGWRSQVRPVRGQIVLLNPGQPLFSPIVCVGKCYLVPRQEGRILVGATEEEAGYDKATTAEGVSHLRQMAYTWIPALRTAAVEQAWAGLRPASPDGLPFIGPVPEFEGLFAAVGHFRAGIQLSLVTAQLLRAWVTGEPKPRWADALVPGRPLATQFRPAFRS